MRNRHRTAEQEHEAAVLALNSKRDKAAADGDTEAVAWFDKALLQLEVKRLAKKYQFAGDNIAEQLGADAWLLSQ